MFERVLSPWPVVASFLRGAPAAALRSAPLRMAGLLAPVLLFAFAYGASARLGLAYSSVAPNVTLIWAPTGISLFVVLRWGWRFWPGIVLGDLIANAGTGAPLVAIFGIAAGNVLQTLVCAWLLQRAGFRSDLARVRDVMALIVLGTVCAALSASIGPASLAASGAIAWAVYPSVWVQWLMGDATGAVVLAPLLLVWWSSRLPGGWSTARIAEAAALVAALVLMCAAVFGGVGWVRQGDYPASLALFPLAVWAALSFGLRGATLLTLVLSAAAIAGTVHGYGPFVDAAETASLLRWWLFANVITITSLVLAASCAERNRAQAQAIHDRDFASAVLDAEGALVAVLDPQWRIQRVNRALEAATGYTLAQLKGRRFEEALIPQAQWHKIEGLADLLRMKVSNSVRNDSNLRRHLKPPIVVSWSVSALRAAGDGDRVGASATDNAIEHVIVSGLDVSARVEAAEALRHARRTLEARVAERTSELAQANAELQVEIAERQRLEGEIIHVSESEQMRFGQELHDGLGQHLTAIAFQAALLARDLEGQSAALVAERIETMLGDAVSQTRLLARGLFPVELEDNGLSAALGQLAANTREFMGLSCELHCPEPVDVQDHAVAIHLYRIAQEAVNNAAKHAGCAHVVIALRSSDDGVLQLRISDDGAGDRRPASGGAGMGLGIMRHRARLIGADIDIGPSSQGTTGWTVSVSVPPIGVRA
ncbi:hypothetical protein BH09PSE5_BH09PSE5_00430 [soil metagenome]